MPYCTDFENPDLGDVATIGTFGMNKKVQAFVDIAGLLKDMYQTVRDVQDYPNSNDSSDYQTTIAQDGFNVAVDLFAPPPVSVVQSAWNIYQSSHLCVVTAVYPGPTYTPSATSTTTSTPTVFNPTPTGTYFP
jgi:hypothetical protein